MELLLQDENYPNDLKVLQGHGLFCVFSFLNVRDVICSLQLNKPIRKALKQAYEYSITADRSTIPITADIIFPKETVLLLAGSSPELRKSFLEIFKANKDSLGFQQLFPNSLADLKLKIQSKEHEFEQILAPYLKNSRAGDCYFFGIIMFFGLGCQLFVYGIPLTCMACPAGPVLCTVGGVCCGVGVLAWGVGRLVESYERCRLKNMPLNDKKELFKLKKELEAYKSLVKYY